VRGKSEGRGREGGREGGGEGGRAYLRIIDVVRQQGHVFKVKRSVLELEIPPEGEEEEGLLVPGCFLTEEEKEGRGLGGEVGGGDGGGGGGGGGAVPVKT